MLLLYRLRLTVNSRPVTLQCLALPDEWKIVYPLDQIYPLSNRTIVSRLAEK